jgi:RNA polymerase sigma factor (sigma-70 family)
MARSPSQIAPPPTDDRLLLSQYAQTRSSEAFAELTHRYADLVYSAARRQLHDAHQAEDVTQAVFILLTQKARTIRGPLAGWLLLTTHYCCRNAIKMASRRHFHEQQAAKMKSEILANPHEPVWEEISGALDAALSRLNSTDRDAIALRYLKGMNLREVGAAMGIGEDAARKRVERGMHRLKNLLGATASAPAVLADQLLQHGIQPAPAHLVHAITAAGGAAAKGTLAAAIAHKAGAAMAWAHLKIAAIVVTAAAIAVPTVPAAIRIVKNLAAPASPTVQTPIPAPTPAPSPAAAPDAPPPQAVGALTEEQILAALQADADITVQKTSPLDGKDLSEAIAQLAVDDSQAPLRSVVHQITRITLENGGVSIMTCSNDESAKQVRDALVADTEENFAFATGSIVVQATGTPPVQIAVARAINDDPGLQYLDVLRLRGYPFVRLSWSSTSTVKRLRDRLNITDAIRKVDCGYFEDNGKEFHLVTINVDAPPDALARWTGGSGVKYRAWGQTVFAVKNAAGDPYPGIYSYQPFDEFACRISRLILFGIKIKSIQYVTDPTTNEQSDPAMNVVCIVDGKEWPLQITQTTSAPAQSAGPNTSLVIGDAFVQSPQTPMTGALQSKLQAALAPTP